MEFTRNSRRIRQLSVVSLIDIVFVLILFFMVAGHIEKFEVIPVELPMADSGQLLDEGPIQVLLGKYDEIVINDEVLDETQVMAELQRQLANNPERIITIKADARMEANQLVAFLEKIRQAGGKNLSIVTQSATIGVTQ